MHAFHSTAVGGDHFEVDFPDRLVDAGERVLEVRVLPAESVQQVVEPDLVEVVDPGSDRLLLIALRERHAVTHRSPCSRCLLSRAPQAFVLFTKAASWDCWGADSARKSEPENSSVSP